MLELQLGKHNGVEFLYEQHSQSDWRNIPVVVHTHNRHAKDPHYQAAWQELGVKHIFYKPETSISSFAESRFLVVKPFVTQGIILARVNYQEADRIITVLSRDDGKLRLMVKGARKSKSKLAGGVELLSISELGVIKGKGDISTLVSSRLIKHFGHIVADIDRTLYAYEILENGKQNNGG